MTITADSITKHTADKCSGCDAVRRKSERWFWVYSDIAPAGRLEPIATYCKSCAATRGLQRNTSRTKATP